VADSGVLAKETIRACAKAHRMKALFLPKISAMQAGSGLHLHFSFCDAVEGRSNLFPSTKGDSLLSSLGEAFVEGILNHLPGLLALTMGSTNSFRRLGPGCWTGHDVRWATEDKEAPLRLCRDVVSQQATHGELKLIDSTSNIYMAIAGLLATGMDGIQQKSQLRPESAGPNGESDCPKLPSSMEESLDCLEADSYLLGVLGKELSTAYLAVKREEAQRYSKMSLEDEVAEATLKS
jgi:glutamine synthetase